MFRNTSNALCLSLCIPLLSGCQSIFSAKEVSVRLRSDSPAGLPVPDYAAEQLQLGRRALDNNDISGAVTAFRNAKQSPALRAAAYNGLAIAYSRLGRDDLTQRYFQEAVALAPDDRRYRANLARFSEINQHTREKRSEPKVAISKTSTPRQQTPVPVRIANGIVAVAPQSRLVRVSAREVRLGSTEFAGLSPQKAQVKLAKAEPPRQYPARISLPLPVALEAGPTGFPVRIRSGPSRERP